jgi:serine/threonine protein phosphatase PrpC
MHVGSALDRLQGRFACDCRGVGADWNVNELRRVSSALLGSLDLIAKYDSHDPTVLAGHLVDWANEQGGHDNITVALARVERDDLPGPQTRSS